MIDLKELEGELALLDELGDDDDGTDFSSSGHELSTSPIFTDAAKSKLKENLLPQYGLLGQLLLPKPATRGEKRSKVFLNTNTPASILVCGVQGSGKSHSVAVLLENMLLKSHALGKLKKPMASLVFHFDSAAATKQPCELSSLVHNNVPDIPSPDILVLVSPSAVNTMTASYSKVSPKIKVMPLYVSTSQINVATILSLMKINPSSGAPIPLYMHSILNSLREMGENFTWCLFEAKLKELQADMNRDQTQMLQQRLSLVETFLFEKSRYSKRGYENPTKGIFKQGQIVICDLSDPFLDGDLACSLFEIMLNLFIRSDLSDSKCVVLDEAHKYLYGESGNGGSSALCNALISLTRLQRHVGLRIILSSQEPNVFPESMLDLCSVLMVHRFSSPTWFNVLCKHTSLNGKSEVFDKIVHLKTGYCLIFAPTGILTRNDAVVKIGRDFIVVAIRKRVTYDAGRSILAVGVED